MRITRTYAALALVGMLAACIPQPARQAEAPPPSPPPRPLPPPPRPAPQATDWRDIPLTPGDWRYAATAGGSEAAFSLPGGGPAFVLRCDRAAGRIRLVRPVGGGTQMKITTSYGTRRLNGLPEGAGVAVDLAPLDPLLDSMAFSRGRFTVESDSGAMLVLPAWPEPARVIEDCRIAG